MPRTTKARVFRSLQTSPNAGTAYDLQTTYGTGANGNTKASFATGGSASSIRWSPNATSIAAFPPPPAGTAAAGVGWRDPVGENATEPVRYDAGTWALRARVTKSGQGALVTDLTIRVTLIVYRVTSTGSHVAELGRVQFADSLISTTTVTFTGSFTTASPTSFAAGDKIQVEAYVQPIGLGSPIAPAASVDFNLITDESQANQGSAFTATPGHQVIYSRAGSDVALASDATTRSTLVARSTPDVAPAADTTTRVAAFPRATPDTARAADTLSRQVVFPRATADTARAVDTLARSTILARVPTDSAVAADTLTRVLLSARSTADTARALDTLTRVLAVARATADTARASDTTTRDVLLSRSTADLARASDTVDRVITYVRSLREQIGPGPGDFVDVPSRVLAGVVRNNGTPVAGATVLLMRVSDDRAVQSTTSAADGAYSFVRDKFDLATYYVVSYSPGAPSTQGVTERGLVPVDA